MTLRNGADICLLAFLILVSGCASMTATVPIPGSPDDLPGCYVIFPAGPWRSVHRIEVVIREGISSALIGVTRGDPSERSLHSLLLTPEGFILFEAELRESGIAVRKAVAPFDSPAFARGLMEDVTLLFLPPGPRPAGWESEGDGTRLCRWKELNGSQTEVKGSMEQGWRIVRRDAQGVVTREVTLKGPFVQGLASYMELRALGPASYKLKMTLLQVTP
jgi:hypothetical protein